MIHMFKTRNCASFSLVQSAFPWRRFGHIETIYRNFFSASLPSLKSASQRTKTHNSVTLSPASPVQRTAMTMSLTPTLPPSISLSSSNPRAANAFRVSYSKLCVRNSKAEGPLRRPSAPLKEATPPMRPIPPSPPSADPPPPPPRPSPPATSSGGSKLTISTVTLEYQRQKAKELQEYFRDKKAEDQASQGLVFGFTQKNEISNGRWAMFGFAVGLLTEYATGSDFVDQLKTIISNLGIADLD